MSLKKSVTDQLAGECGLEPSPHLDEYTVVVLAKVQRIVAINVIQQNCKRKVLQEIQDTFFDRT